MKQWLKKELKQEGQIAVITTAVGIVATTIVFYFTNFIAQNDKINMVATDVAVIKGQVSNLTINMSDIKEYFKQNYVSTATAKQR